MSIRAILFDISGVLYEDDEICPGALETITRLQQEAVPMRFVTNTSRSTSDDILQKLNQMGFGLTNSQIFTAPKAVRQLCFEHQYRPYCLIHPSLAPEFAGLDQVEPNAVIVADAAQQFDYEHLNKAFALMMKGAPLLAIGLNRYFKTQGELQLDAGPFIKALEYAAGVKANVIGKPAKAFFQCAVKSLDVKAEEVLMIGDDVEADVGGALAAGLHACLVKTGKYLAEDEKSYPQAGCSVNIAEAVEQYFYQP